MVITKTPFRVSFFGGGTDYPSWYEKNDSWVVSAAIKKYCYISVRHLPPFFKHKTKAVYSKVECVNDNAEIQHPSINKCLSFLKMTDGLEIHHDADLPARSGIGSSSTFTVGLLHALHALKNEAIIKRELAEQAIHVEQKLLAEHVGVQDQIMAAFGGLRLIEMKRDLPFQVTEIKADVNYLREFEKQIILGFTELERTSSDFAKDQIQQIELGHSDSYLKTMTDLARRANQGLTQKIGFKEFGSLLHESWMLKRKLTKTVTNPLIDELYENGLAAGAWGGKLLGAGGGGFMMFFVPPEKQQALKDRLKKIKVWVPFEIDTNGTQVILNEDHFLTANP
jgi:D-glycero-alpha-D-manno-heptose-7-phosphate kinase